MAYAQSEPVYQRFTVNGRRVVVVSFTETEAAAASEWTIPGDKIPRVGLIKVINATKIAGTGTTIRPTLGRKSGWTAATQDDIGQVAASAAAHIRDVVGMPYNLSSVDNLYGRSTPNDAAADHTIQTELVIVEDLL